MICTKPGEFFIYANLFGENDRKLGGAEGNGPDGQFLEISSFRFSDFIAFCRQFAINPSAHIRMPEVRVKRVRFIQGKCIRFLLV